MKNINKITIIALLTISLSGCKEFLDIKPYGKTIPKTAEEYSALLQYTLNKIDYGEENSIFNNFKNVLTYGTFCDNLDANILGRQSNTLPKYIGDRLNNLMLNYTNLYSEIRNVNLIISNVDTGKELNNNIIGISHTIRAICYYNLVLQFCEPYGTQDSNKQLGVPIVKEFDIEKETLRNTMSECISFIEEDLQKAIELNITDDIWRFNIDVAKFYLLRTYFFSHQWEKAITLANELTKKYPLLNNDDYKDMMEAVNDKKGNVLLKSFLFSNSSTSIQAGASNSGKKIRPVSASFINLFKEKENDIRYKLWFNDKRETTKVLNGTIRGAELYFILAESYIHLNKLQEALNIINQIRDNRIKNNVHYTLNDLPKVDENYLIKKDCLGNELTPIMFALLTERQKEFFMEGDRWWELKRNGRPEMWIAWSDGLKYTTQKFMYTFPIYKRDIDLNNGLIQNPGYHE